MLRRVLSCTAKSLGGRVTKYNSFSSHSTIACCSIGRIRRCFSKSPSGDPEHTGEQSLVAAEQQTVKPYTPEEVARAREEKTDVEFELAAKAFKSGEVQDFGKLIREVNNPLVVPVSDDDQRLMIDPRTEKNSYVTLEQSDMGLLGGMTRADNENTQVRVKDNPLVAEVFGNKVVNINDPRVKIDTPDLQDLALIKESADIAQLNLGGVEVLKKDAVSLKDVDVRDIPEHLDVIVSPRKKEVILLGRKIDSEGVDADEAGSNAEISAYTQNVKSQVFNEKSHEEFQDETAYFFDPKFTVASPLDSVAKFLRSVPFLVLFTCFLNTFLEDHQVDRNPRLLEKQEQDELENFRRKQVMKMTLEKNRTSLADFLGELESNRTTY